MIEVNVLFTSVGRRVELLRSFHQAYRGLGISGRIVALDIDPLAPALQEADRPYVVPPVDSPQYISTLAEILRREQVKIVFPLIDPDIPVLARHRLELEATGARLAVVREEASELAADKWATVGFFRRLGLKVPRSWLPGETDFAKVDYPLFIKPRSGSASQQTFKVENAKELAFFSDYVTDPILQEYVPGPEITNDVICDLEGNVLSVVSRQRIRVRGGEVVIGKTVFEPAVTDGCVRIAEALPAVGPITVQCMMNGADPKYTEINARLGGGLPLGIAAGADSPRWLLAQAAGIPVDIPPLGSYLVDLYLSRFDECVFPTEAQRVQMASHHL